MDRETFEAVVEEALERLPAEFRSRLENIAVMVEDRPARELLRSMGIPRHDTLLGVYQGTPLPQRGPTSYGNVLPDRILLFKEPIEEMGGGPRAVRRRIAETVVHEIGHYFGLSDDEMEEVEQELDAVFGPGDDGTRGARRSAGDDEEGDEDLDEDEDDLEDEEDLDDEDLDEDEDDLDDEDLDEDDDDLDDEDLDEDDLEDDEDLDGDEDLEEDEDEDDLEDDEDEER